VQINLVSNFIKHLNSKGDLPKKSIRNPRADKFTIAFQTKSLSTTSAHGDIPAAVNAIQLGAVDFLQKPFHPQDFLDAINKILRLARERHQERLHRASLRVRVSKLSSRELEILETLLKGYTSKEIARILDISPKTVDVHRANVIRKMAVRDVAELQRLMSKQMDYLAVKDGAVLIRRPS
jgi:FixJ family two-component response regulator